MLDLQYRFFGIVHYALRLYLRSYTPNISSGEEATDEKVGVIFLGVLGL